MEPFRNRDFAYTRFRAREKDQTAAAIMTISRIPKADFLAWAAYGSGDAFLPLAVPKDAGYVWLSRGITMWVRIEEERGKRRVAKLLEVDPSTARPGENEPILHKPKIWIQLWLSCAEFRAGTYRLQWSTKQDDALSCPRSRCSPSRAESSC
jgi:cold shock protein